MDEIAIFEEIALSRHSSGTSTANDKKGDRAFLFQHINETSFINGINGAVGRVYQETEGPEIVTSAKHRLESFGNHQLQTYPQL